MYKNSSQLSEYVEHHTQLLSQRQKIQEIYNAKFEMVIFIHFCIFCHAFINILYEMLLCIFFSNKLFNS